MVPNFHEIFVFATYTLIPLIMMNNVLLIDLIWLSRFAINDMMSTANPRSD